VEGLTRRPHPARRLRARLLMPVVVLGTIFGPATAQVVRSTTPVAAQTTCALSVGGQCVMGSLTGQPFVLDCTQGTVPVDCPPPTGDVQMVLAEIGPAESDPVSALEAASQDGLVGVPDPTSIANDALQNPPSTCSLNCVSMGLPNTCAVSCLQTASGQWNYSYASVEWCDAGWAGCQAWQTWIKGEVHWNYANVWQDWTTCSHSSSSGYSVQQNWCGVWNNGGYGPYNYLDLGENWDRYCCSGANWGDSQSYWARIDIYVGGSHNFRGGNN